MPLHGSTSLSYAQDDTADAVETRRANSNAVRISQEYLMRYTAFRFQIAISEVFTNVKVKLLHSEVRAIYETSSSVFTETNFREGALLKSFLPLVLFALLT